MKWNIFSTTTNLSKHLEGFVVTCIFCLHHLTTGFWCRSAPVISVAGSFSGGADHSILPKFNPFLPTFIPVRGGNFSNLFLPSCCVNLLYQTVQGAKMADKWLNNRQKWRKNRKIWQKPTKSGRHQTKKTEKLTKWRVLQIIFCQASHFCHAKLPFLTCQAPIFVKHTNFFRGGPRPPVPSCAYVN